MEEQKSIPAMASQPWDSDLSRALMAAFPEGILALETYVGQPFAVVALDKVPAVLEFLLREQEFAMLTDLTAVDYPGRERRFELIYILYRFRLNERIRIKTSVASGERPHSVVALYPGANWLEREVFDLFGIEFAGHPDLKRILMPDEWDGHPLRKDYGITQMDTRWVRANLGIESGQ